MVGGLFSDGVVMGKLYHLMLRKRGFSGYDWQDWNEVFEEASRTSRGGVGFRPYDCDSRCGQE